MHRLTAAEAGGPFVVVARPARVTQGERLFTLRENFLR